MKCIYIDRGKTWLNQSYPYTFSISKIVLKNLKLGLFIATFLFVFRPFGLVEYASTKIFGLANVFGLISFLINTLFEIALLEIRQRYLQIDTWLTKDAILKIIGSIMLISLGNTFFLMYQGILNEPFFEAYLEMFIVTFMIGAIPAVFFLNFQQLQYLKENQLKISKLNQQLQKEISDRNSEEMIRFPNESGEIELQVYPSALIYITSESNYLEIHFIGTENTERFILRNRMKNVEKLLPQNFIRCHRSYIVNRDKIRKIAGSKRGYQLELYDTDAKIPVSRSKIQNFSALLKNQ